MDSGISVFVREEEYFSLAEEFAQKLKNGVFSEEMQNQFLHILEYYGQDPFIVRSLVFSRMVSAMHLQENMSRFSAPTGELWKSAF